MGKVRNQALLRIGSAGGATLDAVSVAKGDLITAELGVAFGPHDRMRWSESAPSWG